jgi:hypothetical protein
MKALETELETEIDRKFQLPSGEPAIQESKSEIKFKGGNTMKGSAGSKLSKGFYRAATAIAAIGIALAGPAVNAKPNSNKGEDKPANVVAHVQISGGPATRMLLVKKDGKEYLLVGLSSPATVVVFDVSKADQPRSIDATAQASRAASAEVKVVADTLNLFGSSDEGTASRSDSKELRSISGVTASMKDKARGLVYVTNGDGLWIVKTKQRVEQDAIVDNYGG